MKTVKGQDYSTMLIWAASLVGMIRYAAAFLASDLGQIVGWTSDVISWALGLSGFAMGILGTFGTTYLFDGWRRKIPAAGQRWPSKFVVLTGFVMLAFAAELVILVPFTVSRMAHSSMTDVLGGGVWWWSTAVNIMPMLLLGGVSVGNQIVSVAESSAESFRKVSDTPAESSGNFPTDWRKVRPFMTDAEVEAISSMSTAEIAKKYHLKTEKTARNWRAYAQKELSEKVPA